jgi:hypothetical protein
MTARQQDDWGPAIGSDPDVVSSNTTSKKKPAKKDTLVSLVYDFRDQLMMDTSNLMNAQINAQALATAFRKVLDTGKSFDDVRFMIKQFHKDIQDKPLTDGIPAWKAFIGRLDSLAHKVLNTEPEYNYDGAKIDPRLMKDTKND